MLYKTKTTKLTKKDIHVLPLDELYLEAVGRFKELREEALNLLESQRENQIQQMARILAAKSELGSDGFEEAASEVIAEPQLGQEELKELRTKAFKEVTESFAEEYTLANHPWVVEQLVALVAKWTPVLGSDGLYDPKKTLDQSIDLKKDPWMAGAYILMMYAKRGSLVKDQYKNPNIGYCSLVPLILAGFKKYHGIQYSQWSKTNLDVLVEQPLYLAITTDFPQLEKTDLLKEREAGLIVKTGKKAGEMRSPVSTYRLYPGSSSPLYELPWLLQVMLTQIWCAHPSNRIHTKYMILDPVNWDQVPEPLIDVAVVPQQKPTTKRKFSSLEDEAIW